MIYPAPGPAHILGQSHACVLISIFNHRIIPHGIPYTFAPYYTIKNKVFIYFYNYFRIYLPMLYIWEGRLKAITHHGDLRIDVLTFYNRISTHIQPRISFQDKLADKRLAD